MTRPVATGLGLQRAPDVVKKAETYLRVMVSVSALLDFVVQTGFSLSCIIVNWFKQTCEGDADFSTKHEPATEQDSAVGDPQSRAADDCASSGSQSAANTGENLIDTQSVKSRHKIFYRSFFFYKHRRGNDT